MKSLTCPHCGGDAGFTFASLSVAKVDCKSCGYSGMMGKVQRAQNEEEDFTGFVFGLALGALGGLLLGALFSGRRKSRQISE